MHRAELSKRPSLGMSKFLAADDTLVDSNASTYDHGLLEESNDRYKKQIMVQKGKREKRQRSYVISDRQG